MWCRGWSIVGVGEVEVFVEEGEACVAVQGGEEVAQFFAAFEDFVEVFVAEAYDGVVADGASVVDAPHVGPEAGAEAHVARFAGGVDVAAGEVVCAEAGACVADGFHFAVGRWVVVAEDAVVSAADHDAVFDDDATEGSAIADADAVAGFVDGQLHVLVHGVRVF